MDIIQIISSVIIDLDRLTVKGAENMSLVIGSIQKLDAIRLSLTEAKEKAEAEHVQDQAQ